MCSDICDQNFGNRQCASVGSPYVKLAITLLVSVSVVTVEPYLLITWEVERARGSRSKWFDFIR